MMTPLQELSDRCTGRFAPRNADDFVGNRADENGSAARAVALHLERAVRLANAADRSPIKILLNGEPGLGKTMLALYLARLLGCDKWSTTRLNGTQCKIEVVDDLARELHYRSLFGDWRLLHIDEADAWPAAAQLRSLSLFDDLPNGVAVVLTSNCKLKEFEKRFQTRFLVINLLPPEPREINALLCRFIDKSLAGSIAAMACGNVRSACLDALGVLQGTEPAMLALAA